MWAFANRLAQWAELVALGVALALTALAGAEDDPVDEAAAGSEGA